MKVSVFHCFIDIDMTIHVMLGGFYNCSPVLHLLVSYVGQGSAQLLAFLLKNTV